MEKCRKVAKRRRNESKKPGRTVNVDLALFHNIQLAIFTIMRMSIMGTCITCMMSTGLFSSVLIVMRYLTVRTKLKLTVRGKNMFQSHLKPLFSDQACVTALIVNIIKLRQQATERTGVCCRILFQNSICNKDVTNFADVGGGPDMFSTMIFSHGPVLSSILVSQNLKDPRLIDSGKAKTMLNFMRKESAYNLDFNVENLYLADSSDVVAIASDTSFFILKYSRDFVSSYLDSGKPVDEEGEHLTETNERVRTGIWVGDFYIYHNFFWLLNYCADGEEIATAVHSKSKWKQLGELAMSVGKLEMAEECRQHAMDLSGLLQVLLGSSY